MNKEIPIFARFELNNVQKSISADFQPGKYTKNGGSSVHFIASV